MRLSMRIAGGINFRKYRADDPELGGSKFFKVSSIIPKYINSSKIIRIQRMRDSIQQIKIKRILSKLDEISFQKICVTKRREHLKDP